MSNEDGARRVLEPGDRIAAQPCVVTVHQLGATVAYGWCSTCEDPHVIDLPLYEAGRGPWRPLAPSVSYEETRPD